MPGKRHADRGVELADVDPELERVGRDDAEQLACRQPGLDLPSLLRRVAGAVGRDRARRGRPGLAPPAASGRSAGSARSPCASAGSRSSASPRRRGRRGARRPSESGERRRCVRSSTSGGFHITIRRPARGERVRVHDRRPARRRAARPARRGWRSSPTPSRTGARPGRGGRPARRRRSTFATCEPNTPAVGVRLVDDDPLEVGEEVAPPLVVRQHAHVEHVRVGEDQVRAAPQARAVLARRVAVVDRMAQIGQAELGQLARLVLGERLRRVEVERARLGVDAPAARGPAG